MPTLFKRIHPNQIDLKTYTKRTVSTLLIPEILFEQLHSVLPHTTSPKGKKTISYNTALHYLLNKYKGFLACGNLPFSKKPKLAYQSPNLKLIPAKFRPDSANWFELGVLAYGLGVSRCWLFSYLIELELSGIGEFFSLKLVRDAVATPNASRPRLIHQITGKRHYLNRTLHFRI
jgi:hypothetical protein